MSDVMAYNVHTDVVHTKINHHWSIISITLHAGSWLW
jgi:hypothetical protein